MPISNQLRRSSEEIANLGNEILRTRIEPLVGPDNKGKFVAIAIDNGEYELDSDDHVALSRLLTRQPQSEIWLARIGYKTAYTMRPR